MSHDTLIHRLVRPAVRVVATTGVTPNQLTGLRLALGLAAAAAFAAGGAAWTAAGGGLFLLSLLLDRADGELARQTGRFSPGGHRFDLAADCACNALALLGIGAGQASTLGWTGPLLGALAGCGIGAIFWMLNVKRGMAPAGLSLPGGRVVADADDAMALLAPLLWLGLAAPVLVFAAVVTPLGALGLALAGRRPRGLKRRG